jgi:hypothetical protein
VPPWFRNRPLGSIARLGLDGIEATGNLHHLLTELLAFQLAPGSQLRWA